MKKLLSIAIIASMALVSCSKEENPAPEVRSSEIKVTSTIAGALVKAPINGDVALSGLTFLKVDAASTPVNFNSSEIVTDAARAAGGVIAFGSKTFNYDKIGTKNSYLLGFSAPTSTETAVYKWTIDGSTDHLWTGIWDAGSYVQSNTTGMEFKHMQARLEVICLGKNGENITNIKAAWGKITSIELVNVPTEITYNQDTAIESELSTTLVNQSLLSATYAAYVGQDIQEYSATPTTKTAAAMVAPSASNTFSLTVKTEKFPDGKPVKVTLEPTVGTETGLLAGKIYTVTLSFGTPDKPISPSSTIANWIGGGTGSGDVPLN